MAMGESEQQRMRSFVERYVCARAPYFDPTNEEAEAWECALRGRSLYDKINGLSGKYVPNPEQATQAPPPSSPRPPWRQAVINALAKPPNKSFQHLKDQIADAMRKGAPPSLINRMVREYNDKVADYQNNVVNPPVMCPPSIVDSKGWTG